MCTWPVERQRFSGSVAAAGRSIAKVGVLPFGVRYARFEVLVEEVGADRLLYGTDTPLHFAPAQRACIDLADLSMTEKRTILCDNARRLLRIGVGGLHSSLPFMPILGVPHDDLPIPLLRPSSSQFDRVELWH
ncbi:MAG: amidohydrolase family protein [Pirellulales bacterium]|nr:amidohydrolase family protein [Pirellulales bacterium]